LDNRDKIGEDDESTMLITLDENDDDEKLPKNQTPWLQQHFIAKTFKSLLV
jgi:hypothetical protein